MKGLWTYGPLKELPPEPLKCRTCGRRAYLVGPYWLCTWKECSQLVVAFA